MEIEEIRNRLLNDFDSLITEYEANIIVKGRLEEKELDLKNKSLFFEYEANIVVNNEVDENGKKIHTNEKMREIASQKILNANTEYVELKKEIIEVSKNIYSIKQKLDVLNFKLKCMKSQSDLISSLNRNI